MSHLPILTQRRYRSARSHALVPDSGGGQFLICISSSREQGTSSVTTPTFDVDATRDATAFYSRHYRVEFPLRGVARVSYFRNLFKRGNLVRFHYDYDMDIEADGGQLTWDGLRLYGIGSAASMTLSSSYTPLTRP